MLTSCCKACYVGCRYLFKGPPDYYVGEKDYIQGVSVVLVFGYTKKEGSSRNFRPFE